MQRADARRIVSLAAFNLALGATATPALARAQTAPPPAPAVIHACYVPLTGTLYRIDETGLHQGCTSPMHVEFSWTDGLGAVRTTDALTGDLGGTFAAPSVVGLQGHALSTTAPTAGQVLTFDGSKWGPATASATFTSGVVNGSFLATGTFGSGTIPATGAGVRMMWYPAKAAFRVGATYAGPWDDENIGSSSFASGTGTTASGSSSTAMGLNTIASGNNAVAIGEGATASGFPSFAIGDFVKASGDYSTAMGVNASTNGQPGSFVYGDGSTIAFLNAIAPDQFVVRAQHMWFGTTSSVTATPGEFLETSTGAYLSSGGVWTNVSDVNRKEAFQPISGIDVLARLAAMPVQEWSYKAEGPSIRHIGPTAQDFYAAFHLGSSNTSIGTIDADGVSLAAIKALAQRTRDLASENAKLRSDNERLNARLDAVEAALAALGATPRVP